MEKYLQRISLFLGLIFIILLFFAGLEIYHLFEAYEEQQLRATIEMMASDTDRQRKISKEIEDAKNTTYQNGLCSVIIFSIDRNAQWTYFTSDNGREVVEVNGSFNRSHLVDTLNIISRNNYSVNNFTDIKSYDENGNQNWDNSKIKDISFKIQFVKRLDDSLRDNIYDTYECNYSEITITSNTGSDYTIYVSNTVFSIMDSYIRTVLWGQ